MKNMEKNIIFYFTGTGNSLQAAKIIAKQLENCTLQLVSTYYKLKIPAGYDCQCRLQNIQKYRLKNDC